MSTESPTITATTETAFLREGRRGDTWSTTGPVRSQHGHSLGTTTTEIALGWRERAGKSSSSNSIEEDATTKGTATDDDRGGEEYKPNNLYSPLYYGDAHIEVGHPFKITCIVSRDEGIRWEKDGEDIEKEINWDIEGAGGAGSKRQPEDDIYTENGGGAGTGKEENVSGEGDALEWGSEAAAAAVGLSMEDDEWRLWQEWMVQLSSSGTDGHLERLKRNVSELERFNLRRYYNAVVNFKNMPGGGGYFMDKYLGRNGDTQEKATQEQLQNVEEGVKEADEEKVGRESLHNYVFTQGQVQRSTY